MANRKMGHAKDLTPNDMRKGFLKRVNVLVISGTFPSKENPSALVFVKNQIEQLSKYVNITVVITEPVFVFSRKGLFVRRRQNYLVNKKADYKIYSIPFYLPSGRLSGYVYAYSQFLSVLFFLLRYGIKAEIVHCHFVYPEGFAGVLIGKLLNWRSIITAHGSDLLVWPERSKFLKRGVQFALRHSDRIICVSQTLRREAINLGADESRTIFIPNGLDFEVFRPLSMNRARERLGLPLKKKIVTYIGSMVKVKGVSNLVEAIPCVLSLDRNIIFLIIGQGKLENQLKKRVYSIGIEKDVKFVGVKKNEEIPYWINASNLICIPSVSEGFGIVAIESLTCGVPVVASNVGGIPEIIKDESLGILFPPGDLAALSSAIVWALSKKWDGEKMREYVMKRCDWDLISQKIVGQYLDIVKKVNSYEDSSYMQ